MPRNASKRSTRPLASSGRFEVVVVGVSAGGVDLLLQLLPALPGGFPVPVLVCLHSAQGTTAELADMLDQRSAVTVREASDKEVPQRGHVYLAPGGYHLLLERDGALSLSVDEPVRFARPSVDVLFDSAAHVHRERVLAIVLSGANDDGAQGVRRVKAAGGMVVVQDPASAVATDMPRAALAAVRPDHCVKPEELPKLLQVLCTGGYE
jgi:two-component system chemotaxis response regulator CheB